MNNGRNVIIVRARASRMIHVVLAGCLGIVASASAHAQSTSGYVFVSINCPGLTNPGLLGINASSATVGNGTDSSGNNVPFKYSGGTAGTCTPLPTAPGGLGFYAQDINDSGTIVGIAAAADGSYEDGFILQGSAYTLVSHPPQTFVEMRGINSAGLVAGDAWSTDTAGNTINTVGFIYNPATGSFRDIVVPNSIFVIARGINTVGQVVGSATFSGNQYQGFFCAADTGTPNFCDPNIPGAQTLFTINGQNTRARGINDQGLIDGFVYGHGLPPAGFVGTSSGYTLLNSPGLGDIYVEGIGNGGEVTGQYYEDAGDTIAHGFIATLAYAPSGTTSNGAYTFTVDVIPNTPISIDPAPALGFDYATGTGDPLFTTVRLPVGIGDSQYTLIVNHKEYPLPGGQLFDFTEHGFPGGVSNFRVTDIEVSANVDPNNPTAFPTHLAFSGTGQFTGSMTPLCLKSSLPPQVPPQAVRALLQPCK